MGVLQAKQEKGWCYVDLNKLVFTFGLFYICANIGENRLRNVTMRVCTDRQIHTQTQTNFIIRLMLYSYGADNYANSLQF